MLEVSASAVRDVEIATLSARDELVAVVRVAMVVVFGVWLYLANESSTTQPAAGAQKKNLLPFQAVVQDRSLDEQRMFRLLQVGLLEAENLRSTTGTWPAVEAMEAEGIEPFAPDPTNRGATYRWQLFRNGFTIGYIGVPDRQDASAWLIFVQEPDPSLPPEPFQNDEEHHRLVDGLVLHVSIWIRPAAQGAQEAPVLPRLPQAERWSQLFAVGPSATH
jgi:hypothetical protein